MVHSVSYSEYITFITLIILWCFLHSAMISLRVTDYLKKHAANQYRYYRLFFNVIAASTLISLLLYKHSIQTDTLFDWNGYMRIIQVILIITGIGLFLLGAKKYDFRRFIGLSQLNEQASSPGLTQSGGLDTSGILSVMRHPWYTGLLLVLWARPMDMSTLLLNIGFTMYLLVGARQEEKKLVNEFGDAYRHYQRDVDMLFPFKLLTRR